MLVLALPLHPADAEDLLHGDVEVAQLFEGAGHLADGLGPGAFVLRVHEDAVEGEGAEQGGCFGEGGAGEGGREGEEGFWLVEVECVACGGDVFGLLVPFAAGLEEVQVEALIVVGGEAGGVGVFGVFGDVAVGFGAGFVEALLDFRGGDVGFAYAVVEFAVVDVNVDGAVAADVIVYHAL